VVLLLAGIKNQRSFRFKGLFTRTVVFASFRVA
jgi:hypothetical protein